MLQDIIELDNVNKSANVASHVVFLMGRSFGAVVRSETFSKLGANG